MPMCLMPLMCMYVIAGNITFYLKFGFCWVSWARETANQVEVALELSLELYKTFLKAIVV